MLDYTSKSSTFAYNCLSYVFMLISRCVDKKMWEHVKLDGSTFTSLEVLKISS